MYIKGILFQYIFIYVYKMYIVSIYIYICIYKVYCFNIYLYMYMCILINSYCCC